MFTFPLHSMQNSKNHKIISSLAELAQGYFGYHFSEFTKQSASSNLDRVEHFALSTIFLLYKMKLNAGPVQEVNKMAHGIEKFIKKVIIPRSTLIKVTINYSKILLGFGGATYFYLSDVKHKYAYCAGALLFAYNAFTNGNFEKSPTCSCAQGVLKFFFKKNSNVDKWIK